MNKKTTVRVNNREIIYRHYTGTVVKTNPMREEESFLNIKHLILNDYQREIENTTKEDRIQYLRLWRAIIEEIQYDNYWQWQFIFNLLTPSQALELNKPIEQVEETYNLLVKTRQVSTK